MKIDDLPTPYITDLGSAPQPYPGAGRVTTQAYGEESGSDGWSEPHLPGSELGDWIRSKMPAMPTMPGSRAVTTALYEDAV